MADMPAGLLMDDIAAIGKADCETGRFFAMAHVEFLADVVFIVVSGGRNDFLLNLATHSA
jgi:hypothetical protein